MIVLKSNKEVEMPNTPQNRWYMIHNKKWLKQRGFPNKGTADTVKKWLQLK